MALLRITVVQSRSTSKRNAILIYTYTFISSYLFLSLYVTLHLVVLRVTSNAEMTYIAAKLVRLLSPSVTDDGFNKFKI